MILNFDFKILFNDLKWLNLINYVKLENIIIFECFEKFPNSGLCR